MSRTERPLLWQTVSKNASSLQLIFLSRCVVEFDREQSSSDGGALLLREVDRRLRLTERLAACFADHRDHRRLEHSVEDMLRQRVFSLALGYEDLNDQELLKKDPMLRLLISKKDQEQDLAAKTTLNRLELSTGMTSRFNKVHYWREALDKLLLDLFVQSLATVPEQIVLDLDATDIPLHGTQLLPAVVHHERQSSAAGAGAGGHPLGQGSATNPAAEVTQDRCDNPRDGTQDLGVATAQLPNSGRVPTSAPCPALLTGPTLIFDSFRPKRRIREPLTETPCA